MFDVPLSAGRFKQRVLCSKLQYWRAGAISATGDAILLDLCGAETLQKSGRRRPGRSRILKGRHFLSLRLSLLIFLVAPALAAPVYKAGDWIVLTPPDEGFSVQLPVKPEEQTDRSTFQSSTYKNRLYTCNDEASGMLYMVVMQEFPEFSSLTPAARLDNFMDGFKQGFVKSLAETSGMKVDVQVDRDINLKGAAIGRQYIVSVGEMRGLLRAFDANPRTYVLMVVGGDEKKAEVSRFFDSFVIKAAPPPVPQPLTPAKPE